MLGVHVAGIVLAVIEARINSLEELVLLLTLPTQGLPLLVMWKFHDSLRKDDQDGEGDDDTGFEP